MLYGDKTNMYTFPSNDMASAVNTGSTNSYRNDYNTEGWFGRVPV